MNNEKPENFSSENDASTAEDKRTLSENTGESPSRVKKEIKPPETLVDFIKSIYSGSKINKTTRTAFKSYQDTISDNDRKEILSLANDKDPDCRLTLLLADFFLEQNARSRNAILLISCIEYVISNVASLKDVASNTVFQSWLDQSDGVSDKLSFFSGQINRISYFDDKGNTKPLKDKKRNNILCIAAIWLYDKGASDFNSLLRYLSRNAFNIKGEKGAHVESSAFAFASSMITSTKKAKFAYFLSMVSEHEKDLSDKVSQKDRAIYQLNEKLTNSKNNNNQLLLSLKEAETTIAQLNNEISHHVTELTKKEEHAKHTDIHHNDSQDDLKAQVCRFLEGKLNIALQNAKIANSRTPAKIEVVDYQLSDALEIIEKELIWLKS